MGVSLFVVRTLAEAVQRLGLDSSPLTEGIDADQGDDPKVRIDHTRFAAAIDAIANQRPGVPLGVELARALPFGSLFIIDHYWGASSTLFEALTRAFTCAQSVGWEDLAWELEPRGELTRLVQTPGFASSVISELTFTLVAERMRMTATLPVTFTAVRFAHPAPEGRRQYDELFGVHVEFDAAETELVFPTGLLSAPLHPVNPLDLLKTRYTPVPPKPSRNFILEVEEAISDCLRGSADARLRFVARKLAVSPRTLQRRLAENGTTLSRVLDEVRRSIAIDVLKREDISLNELAERLGFDSVGAVHRSFQKWTGTTPRAYQRAHQQQPQAAS